MALNSLVVKQSNFFQDKEIIHQRSCPYTLQRNGVVERKHKYLLETARALLFQSKLPIRFWGECILTATYIINRLPTKLLQDKSPYELLYQRKPIYSHLRSFGCLCFPTTLKPHKDKFEPRTTPHILVSYPFNRKGYKVLDLATRRVHVSRDVIFHESVSHFVIASVGSTFDSIIKLLVHKLPCKSSTFDFFVDDDLLETSASHEVTDNQIHTQPQSQTSDTPPQSQTSCHDT